MIPTTVETILLPETHPDPQRRLGRHVRHDIRSWGFPAPMAGAIRSVRHARHVPIFNQGDLGACTGMSAVGCVSSGPFAHRGTQAEAVDVYSAATKVDEFAGEYPPTDTGSSGLAVMKVLQSRGIIAGYTHVFDFQAFLRALVLRPGITGITWRAGCDTPNAEGLVVYAGTIRGGHEVVPDEIDVERKRIGFQNSWGPGFGLAGRFYMSWDDYAKALADHGDATFPLPSP